jgi:glycosyltransferase involved in cell wall biosynthesis
LRLLFIGEIGLRKGVPYLLEALRMLNTKKVHAKLVGKIALSREIVTRYTDVADFVGSVPRSDIKSLYDWADVFVLPSICEGSATVTYEALASGVPVICTPNTGSMVRDRVDGHIVPIRNPEAIAQSIENYLKTPGLLEAEQNEAIKGRERLGIEAYGERLVKAIDFVYDRLP